jgi:hypothetical protein
MSVLRPRLALDFGGSLSRLLFSPDSQTRQRAAQREYSKTRHPSERYPVFDCGQVPGYYAINGTEDGH